MTHIDNLAALFNSGTVIAVPAGTKFSRGCWLQLRAFPNGSWFSPDTDGAAQYIAMGAECGRKLSYEPVISQCVTTKELRLIEFHGNHISAFASAYGRNWSHDELPQDIANALALNAQTDLDGFLRPSTAEYFICSPADVLVEVSCLSGQAALEEASKVKGYEV